MQQQQQPQQRLAGHTTVMAPMAVRPGQQLPALPQLRPPRGLAQQSQQFPRQLTQTATQLATSAKLGAMDSLKQRWEEMTKSAQSAELKYEQQVKQTQQYEAIMKQQQTEIKDLQTKCHSLAAVLESQKNAQKEALHKLEVTRKLCETLRDELNKNEESFRTVEEIKKTIRADWNKLAEDYDTISRNLQALSLSNGQLNTDLSNKQQEIARLTERVQCCENEAVQLHTEIQAKNERIKTLELELSKSTRALEDALIKNADLHAQSDQDQSVIERLQQDLNSHRQEIAELNKVIDSNKEQMNVLQQRIIELGESCSILVADHQEAVEAMRAEYQNQLQEQADKLKRQLSVEYQALLDKYNQVQQTNTALTTQYEECSVALSKCKAELGQTLQVNEELQNAAENVKKAHHTQESTLYEKQDELERVKGLLQSQHEELNTRISELEQQLTQVTSDYEKSRDAMAVVLSDTSAAANEKRELERKLQAALDEQSQLEIDLQQHTAASRAEAERLKREMTRLKKSEEQARRMQEQMERENAELKEKLKMNVHKPEKPGHHAVQKAPQLDDSALGLKDDDPVPTTKRAKPKAKMVEMSLDRANTDDDSDEDYVPTSARTAAHRKPPQRSSGKRSTASKTFGPSSKSTPRVPQTVSSVLHHESTDVSALFNETPTVSESLREHRVNSDIRHQAQAKAKRPEKKPAKAQKGSLVKSNGHGGTQPISKKQLDIFAFNSDDDF